MDPHAKFVFAENRRARFDYEILAAYEAGIELTGQEVKSVKGAHASLTGSYAVIRGGEVWLLNANIPPYQMNNCLPEYDPLRTRRLLLRKKEIAELTGTLHEKGLSLTPLKLYAKRGIIKIELALARARKKHDKRAALKKRGAEREMRTRG